MHRQKKFLLGKIFLIILVSLVLFFYGFKFFIDRSENNKIINTSIENVAWPYNDIDYVKVIDKNNEHLKVAIVDTGVDTSVSCLKHINISTYTINNVHKVSNDVHGTIMADIIFNSKFLDRTQDSLRKSIQFYAINVGNDDNIKIDSLIKGIQKAVSLNVDIINISLGVYLNNPSLKNAINNALSKDIIVVCSAGNDSTKQDMFPSSYKGVISVTSVDQDNNYLLNSNSNDNITLSAPGEDIPTNVLINGKSIYMNGTSVSTAIITSSIIALKSINISLKPKDVIEIFKSTCKKIGDKNIYGYGLLDYKKALSKVNQYK